MPQHSSTDRNCIELIYRIHGEKLDVPKIIIDSFELHMKDALLPFEQQGFVPVCPLSYFLLCKYIFHYFEILLKISDYNPIS